jgi:hypothetical protein
LINLFTLSSSHLWGGERGKENHTQILHFSGVLLIAYKVSNYRSDFN